MCARLARTFVVFFGFVVEKHDVGTRGSLDLAHHAVVERDVSTA
jgi:hypothetical protein